MTAAFEVVTAGPRTTLQDLGRPGLAHLGVPRSGAADEQSHRRANDAVGNAPGAATLETTLGGCVLRARAPAVVAVAGAPSPVFVGDVPAPFGMPFRLAPGQVLEVGPADAGLRAYVAVRGGFAAEPVLGSRATCQLTGLGPAPLADGDTLEVAADASGTEPAFGRRPSPAPAPEGTAVLTLHRGPRDDWFAPAALEALVGAEFTVSADSNRVGLRLDGPQLERAVDGELASEGMVLGAVQVPPSGLPIVFLADHPTTGGYPVIGVVDPGSVSRAAQARPGSRVRFALA